MKCLPSNSLWVVGIVVALVAQPAKAEVVQVTGVQLNPTDNGLEVRLKTPTGQSPQAFTTRYGQTLFIDIANTRCQYLISAE